MAVLNCKASTSGTYPNLGPQLLVEAGVLLVDLHEDSLFHSLSDGDPVTVRVTPSETAAGEVLYKGHPLAAGEVLDLTRVRAETEARRREVGDALERFAHNTIAHMREERELLAGRIDLPRFRTDFRDRSTLVVVRGVDHQRDLRALRSFIRDTRPVLVAVDGGADALLEAGLSPHMIVGDMDSASEAALLGGPRGQDRAGGALLSGRSRTRPRTPGGARPSRSSWSRHREPARTWRCCSPRRRGPA